jgi:hypothetical protein
VFSDGIKCTRRRASNLKMPIIRSNQTRNIDPYNFCIPVLIKDVKGGA